MTDSVITLDETWEDNFMANVIASKESGRFFVIIYFYNYHYNYYYRPRADWYFPVLLII